MTDLTLVIPAKQEAESLPKVLKEIIKLSINCKIKICIAQNDYKTIEAIKNFKGCEVYFQKSMGYGSALIEGIKNVKTKYFCIFNADGSFNPNELINMKKDIKFRKLDFLFASRYLKNSGSDDDTYITCMGNLFFSAIGKYIFKMPISDILYTFVLGKTSKFRKINFFQNDFRFCVELPIKCFKNNYKIADITSYERARIGGKKKVNALKDGILILFEIVKLYFYKND